MKKIAVIAGSERKNAYSGLVAKNLLELAPDGLQLELLTISNLEMFNQDYDEEGKTPESWKAFRSQISNYDGFIFVTPEYNRSFTPLLKNALDIASRPYGQNKWDGKPAAIFGVSMGGLSGFGAVQHLKNVAAFLNLNVMPQPEVYLGGIMNLIDENGKLVPNTATFLSGVLTSFSQFVSKNS